MYEYVTEALVLHREPVGDLDDRISLFTRRFGKLVAKTKSTRKTLSKLSPHLQPGNVVTARIVERHGLQLVDALKSERTAVNLADLHTLHRLLAEGEPEPSLWQMTLRGTLSWSDILRILGWDPMHASCGQCRVGKVAAFSFRSQEFFCLSCASALPKTEVLYMHPGSESSTVPDNIAR